MESALPVHCIKGLNSTALCKAQRLMNKPKTKYSSVKIVTGKADPASLVFDNHFLLPEAFLQLREESLIHQVHP